MDMSAFRLALIIQHHTEPQAVAKIEHACRELSGGLDALASMGHLYHLEEGAEQARDEWPKLLFHFSDSPLGRKVYTKGEAQALGPGWSPDPIEAQRLGGEATQNAGKAGLGAMGLPANVYKSDLSEEARVAERTRAREEAKANLINQRAESSKTRSGPTISE